MTTQGNLEAKGDWERMGALRIHQGGTCAKGTPPHAQACQPALTGSLPASRFSSNVWLKPVAMMVTCTSPSYWSSITAPKMTLALGSARDVTTSDTRLTSCSVRSLPPVMLYTMPVARSMLRSISGADVAACSHQEHGVSEPHVATLQKRQDPPSCENGCVGVCDPFEGQRPCFPCLIGCVGAAFCAKQCSVALVKSWVQHEEASQ